MNRTTLGRIPGFLAAALALGLWAGPAAAQGGDPPGPSATIRMERNHRFVPVVTILRAGAEVVWQNEDAVPLAIIGDPLRARFEIDIRPPAPPEPFHSDPIAPGSSFRRRFELEGVYRFVSDRYEEEGMNGVLIVKAPPDASSPGGSPERSRDGR